jgi:cellulose synthase/poly-beta-1,6-N-acetylglucosamine synthase-like glycosyltransferase
MRAGCRVRPHDRGGCRAPAGGGLELLIAAALLLGVGLVGVGLGIEARRRRAPPLPELPGDEPAGGDGPGDVTVTVLLPVRDEERNLLPCLEALLALAGRPPVRVIDDGSRDATAALAAAAAAGEARLTLVDAGALPAGWRGKVHALWAGARGVESTWLLATDADVRQGPSALARALAAAAHWRLDAVSLAGFQEARGLAENLLVPGVFALLDAWLGDWEEAAASGGEPVANGQFLLLRRAAWESCGGFEGVRNEAIDDVAAAALMRNHGYRTGFFRAPDLLSVRMYRGAGEVIRGWRRNLGGLVGPRRGASRAALAVLVLPVLAMAGALAAGCGVAAVLLWSAGAVTSGVLRAGSGHRPAYALLYPLDALLLAGVLAAGSRDRRRGRLLNWKGREMRV